MKRLFAFFLLTGLLLSCKSDLEVLEEIAGDWTADAQPVDSLDSTRTAPVGIRVDITQEALLFFEVPDNDWGYSEGDVAVYDLHVVRPYSFFGEAPGTVQGWSRLNYVTPLRENDPTMLFYFYLEGEDHLIVYQDCEGCSDPVFQLRR